MISKTIDKLTSLTPWQLLLVGVLASEALTLLFSSLFSFILWGHVSKEVLIIGIIDAFLVAFIIVFFTIIIVKRIHITEITNKQLREEIEERKHAEKKNETLEKQLRQAMKMEAIGTLAGGIAHDFNNILSAIIGYCQIAKLQLPADDKAAKYLDQVLIAGHRAAELVQQILTFSRQGEEQLKPLNVQPLLKEVLKLLRSSLPTTITLKETISDNCGMILANPGQVHQVLMNICTNARQAIGEELGTLSVSLSQVQLTEDRIITDCLGKMNGTYLDLAISDTGCGMDNGTVSKIFDPFFTTKEVGKGTGLGLAVVHGIIKQHKGEITVTSKEGKGTTFHIYLPVITQKEIICEQIIPEDIPHGDGERILFVDDEITIANMMQIILTDLGYKTTILTSSLEAVKTYQKNPAHFDLVITDMTMPEMTGVELSRKLLTLQPDVSIILCTGFSESIDASRAKSIGIRKFLDKPFDQLTLAKTIRNVLKNKPDA